MRRIFPTDRSTVRGLITCTPTVTPIEFFTDRSNINPASGAASSTTNRMWSSDESRTCTRVKQPREPPGDPTTLTLASIPYRASPASVDPP